MKGKKTILTISIPLSFLFSTVALASDVTATMQKAIDVVKQHRNDFDLTEMILTVSKPQESKSVARYMFEWRLYKEDVDIGHTIYVEISGKGDFLCFMCNNNREYEPDLSKVKYNEDDVKELAVNYLKKGLDYEMEKNLIVDSSQLRLYNNEIVWVVELSASVPMQGDESRNDTYYFLLIINTENGSIISEMAG